MQYIYKIYFELIFLVAELHYVIKLNYEALLIRKGRR